MRKFPLVLGCLACVGHAHVPNRVEQVQGDSSQLQDLAAERANSTANSMSAEHTLKSAEALAKFLVAFNPAAAYNPSGSAISKSVHPAVRRKAATRPSFVPLPRDAWRHRKSPLMSEPSGNAFDDFQQGDEAQDLAVRDDVAGTGEVANNGNVVSIKYAGRLMSNGKQFDAGDIAFKLGEGRVIQGWEKGLEGMRVGGKRTLRIPARMGYGSKGAPGAIPPDSDLEFDCELLGVASGPIAEISTLLGIGLNIRTALVALLVATFVFPDFFNNLLGAK